MACNGNFADCWYVDGTLYQCNRASKDSAKVARPYMVITSGPENFGPTCGPNKNQSCDLVAPEDFYVAYMRVWSCPGWATQECNGSVLNGAP